MSPLHALEKIKGFTSWPVPVFPVFIFGITTILAVIIVAIIWFIFLFVTLYPTTLNSLT